MTPDQDENENFQPMTGHELAEMREQATGGYTTWSNESILRLLNQIDRYREGLQELNGLVGGSEGVVGWHMNGDVLRWEQCDDTTWWDLMTNG